MSGKGSRAKAKARRDKEKKARKAQKIALYASYRDGGDNSKRKRIANRRTAKKAGTVKHPVIPCGNPACMSCCTFEATPYLTKDGKYKKNIPQWAYLRIERMKAAA